MRLLTRYILREVVSYTLLGAVLFTFVLFMRDLPKILELVVRDSATLSDVLRIFAYTLPNTLTVTIPTAVLAGILLGLSRLAADSEITAMRACGIGALSFVRIVSILSFAALALGLVNALYFAPSASANLLKLEDQLKSSQASFQVQPRVFYEDFKDYVLYVQDVPATGAATWRHVFLADITQPANPNITTADQALVFNPGPASPQGLRLHLLDGGQHQFSPTNPNQYTISTFASTDLPLQFDSQDDTHISRVDTPLHALSLRQLLQRAYNSSPGNHSLDTANARAARIELNIRFSYPLACLVLMLIGVPLGLSSRRGGKSTGVVLTLFLVFAYYLLSNIGVAFAKSGKLSPYPRSMGRQPHLHRLRTSPPTAARGYGTSASLLHLMGRIPGQEDLLHCSRAHPRHPRPHHQPHSPLSRRGDAFLPADAASFQAPSNHSIHARALPLPPPRQTLVQRMSSLFRTSFPLLLDEYVLRAYAANLVLSSAAFALLFLVFTFFELIGDIVHNGIALLIVGDYLFNLIPYVVSTLTPLCSLLAVLITFGALNRNSELTAMKATGISLYRVVAPIFVLAAILSSSSSPSTSPICPTQTAASSPPRRNQGEARADLPPPRPSMDLRPNRQRRRPRPHLLLPGLRSLQHDLRQPHRLRIRSRHLRPPTPHPAKSSVGTRPAVMGLRQRMAEVLLR